MAGVPLKMLGSERSLDLEKPPDVFGRELLGRVVVHGRAMSSTSRELIGDGIVSRFEVSRAGWVKTTQAEWPTLQRQ
jgi:hypothetical protein